ALLISVMNVSPVFAHHHGKGDCDCSKKSKKMTTEERNKAAASLRKMATCLEDKSQTVEQCHQAGGHCPLCACGDGGSCPMGHEQKDKKSHDNSDKSSEKPADTSAPKSE